MKKISLALVTILMFVFSFSTMVSAEIIIEERSWIDEIVENDPLYQELKLEHGEIVKVSEKEHYIVAEYGETSDGEVGIVRTTSYDTFPKERISELEQIKQEIDIDNPISPLNVYPGDNKEYNFGVIKVGLAMYRASIRYYLTTTFEWVTLPNPSYMTNMHGVVGLSVADQLTIEGNSVHGTYYWTRYSTSQGTTSGANSLSTRPASLNGVAGTFSSVHQKGSGVSDYLTALRGNLSCTALKSNPYNITCSGLAEYVDVNKSIRVSDVSVSYPAGVSINVSNTQKTSYPVLGALMLGN